MAWTIQAMGFPDEGEPRRWRGSLSSALLPHGVLACRAAVLNLLADGVTDGIRSWEAVGAITSTRTAPRPITVAYADVYVPAEVTPITEAPIAKRTVFDLLVKMTDPGRTIAELELLIREGQLGGAAINRLLDLSTSRPTPSLDELYARVQHRIL